LEASLFQKFVKEGDYVQTGQSLFKIVDFSQLWLKLDAYESDLVWLKYGQKVHFTVESFPGKTFEGQIAFIDPEVSRETRTAKVRVNVDNAASELKPGMLLRVWLLFNSRAKEKFMLLNFLESGLAQCIQKSLKMDLGPATFAGWTLFLPNHWGM
jgi:hypothetical protein